ncbi:hypothetical protein Isop_1474 [Isosphaera pallida ATCC 43644]|jgi:hypothetical protein|uniref:Uncharacterized protein n=1 Tax=Isosphaera pallida (strain ATCC 43644 / DSM 9630 / IS1B) TaxID=575540 RepID=E8QY69_ISOPI|nr:hypothetical protein [Isosphaera pallida]ADV62059.1 hypothetical protein Isop_1474 [Isosphaera pallida ATCC 43644]
MSRTALDRGPFASPKRWVHALAAVGLLAVFSMGTTGCALPYWGRSISPLHPSGWGFPYPIFASVQQQLEDDIQREEFDDRVPILDPIPPNSTAPLCLDPPSEKEVWDRVPKIRHGISGLYEVQYNNVRILIEKIGEQIDPPKIYPLAGPCQKVSCHYKCTVYYDALYWSDYPIPFNHVDHKVEVIYIDKDFLRRVAGPENVTRPPVENTLNAPVQNPY